MHAPNLLSLVNITEVDQVVIAGFIASHCLALPLLNINTTLVGADVERNWCHLKLLEVGRDYVTVLRVNEVALDVRKSHYKQQMQPLQAWLDLFWD